MPRPARTEPCPPGARTHLALLRGVNVAGRSVPMADLREVVSALGWRDVSTYIQSGNIIGTPPDPEAAIEELAATLESALTQSFGMGIPAVVLSRAEVRHALAHVPYVAEPNPARVHVIAFAEPRSPQQADRLAALAASLAQDGGRDRAVTAGRFVYLHTPDGYARSKLAVLASRLPEDPMSSAGTARNLRTLRRLAELMGQSAPAV